MIQNFQVVVNLGAQQQADDKRMHQFGPDLGIVRLGHPREHGVANRPDEIFHMPSHQILRLKPDFLVLRRQLPPTLA